MQQKFECFQVLVCFGYVVVLCVQVVVVDQIVLQVLLVQQVFDLGGQYVYVLGVGEYWDVDGYVVGVVVVEGFEQFVVFQVDVVLWGIQV